ncbi:hypothetical protein C6376_30195 [Streptomyces sp. P3]|nr:hypothetical protein C6376_30195 [Streptomyces sp. P3]
MLPAGGARRATPLALSLVAVVLAVPGGVDGPGRPRSPGRRHGPGRPRGPRPRLHRHPGPSVALLGNRRPRSRFRGALRTVLHGASSGVVGTCGHYGWLLLVRQAP